MRQETMQTKWGVDRYVFMEASEIPALITEHATALSARCNVRWSGDSFADFRHKAELGDEALVAESERFLAEIEDQVPMSRGWRTVDDVVGAVPNVPAFLAGHPQCMRRRQRVARDTAPLAIYMDLTSSGGIGAYRIMRRGVVLLALTRMLVEHRAVELWVGASLGSYNKLSGTVAWRVDTAPLDLARAGYHVAATAMSRTFGYSLSRKLQGTTGQWPFNNYGLHVRTAAERLRPVLGSGGELLYVPPIYVTDPLTTDPVGWLRRTLSKHTQQED